jgi:hypothetical protein
MLLRARAIHGKTHDGECRLIRRTDWMLRKIEQLEQPPSKEGPEGRGPQAERNFARILRMQDQWAALDEAILGSGSHDDNSVRPWESSHPTIHAAWEQLTDPANLDDLEYWLAFSGDRPGMYPRAKAAILKAIEVCKAKNAGRTTAEGSTHRPDGV